MSFERCILIHLGKKPRTFKFMKLQRLWNTTVWPDISNFIDNIWDKVSKNGQAKFVEEYFFEYILLLNIFLNAYSILE